MKNRVSIELCCGSLEDCKLAERVGADPGSSWCPPICWAGSPPPPASSPWSRSRFPCPSASWVRPRGAGFCYSDEDFSVMCEDARRFSRMGADGVVFGFLTADGRLDYERCARFLECTDGCETVFHRAIDVTENMLDAASKLVSLGVTRVLTSGGCADALTGRARHPRDAADVRRPDPGPRRGRRARGQHPAPRRGDGVSRVHLGGTAQVSDPSTLLNPTLNFGSSLPPSNDCYLAVNETTVRGVMQVLGR